MASIVGPSVEDAFSLKFLSLEYRFSNKSTVVWVMHTANAVPLKILNEVILPKRSKS